MDIKRIKYGYKEVADMTIEEMKARKIELGYSYEQIAEYSGVPVGTVQKIFGGITKAPRYDTLRALERVFEEVTIVEEPAVYYAKRQGDYRITDYDRISEEQWVELIDGVIYDMSAPTGAHQAVAGEVFAGLREYVRANKGKCIVLMSPIDVQLDCDDKTMLQPDVLVVCDKSKLKEKHVYGAPDMVIEVTSPATRKKDMSIKLCKYSEAGVREYWIIDPDKKKVIVYNLENNMEITMYSEKDSVPVNIFGGECIISFEEIFDYVESIYS